MTSTLRGDGGLKNRHILWTNSTDRLREMRTKGGGGVQNPEICADVLNGSSLTSPLVIPNS